MYFDYKKSIQTFDIFDFLNVEIETVKAILLNKYKEYVNSKNNIFKKDLV